MNGVRGLTAQDIGVYTMLLCRIYEGSGPVEYHAFRLATYCGMREAAFEKALGKLLDLGKLTLDSGMIRSEVLDDWVLKSRNTDKRPWVPLLIQRWVFERDGMVCAYCHTTEGPFHLDHIKPWAVGGEHTAENLTVACSSCNWSKGSKTLAEWRGF